MASAARLAPIEEVSGIETIHITPRSEIQVVHQTKFEELIEELGLEAESLPQLASARSYKHIALRLWCRKHVHTRYVPTYLIDAWGIQEWNF